MAGEMHVIVGAGQAGAWAAVSLREAGFAGRILLVGDEPHRPYERPPLSKQALTLADPPPPIWFHPEQRYADLGIELRLGVAADGIDAVGGRLHLVDGETLPYDRLLLATGGRARTLDVPGGDRVLTLRTLDDAHRLRAALAGAGQVVCIGAGVIGLEIAASAHALGAAVTVLEAAPMAMGRSVSPEGAAFVTGLHVAAGVALHFGALVEAVVEDAPGRLRVICTDGLEVTADCVVAGVGMLRNTALAAEAGAVVENGILVDALGRTSLPGVHAAGDVAAFPHPLLGGAILRQESWRHAQNHGVAVGRAMAGGEDAYDDVPWFWTDQHGINLQVTGLPALATRTVLRPPTTAAPFTAFHLDEAGRVVGVTAANDARAARAGQALIRSGKLVDPSLLADPAVPMQRLATAR